MVSSLVSRSPASSHLGEPDGGQPASAPPVVLLRCPSRRPFSSCRPLPPTTSSSFCAYSLFCCCQASPGRLSLSFVASQSHTIISRSPSPSAHRVRTRKRANQQCKYNLYCSAITSFLLSSIRILYRQSSRSLFCFFRRHFHPFLESCPTQLAGLSNLLRRCCTRQLVHQTLFPYLGPGV